MLLDIYVEYGFSKEFTVNVVKPGKSGAEEIKAMMENFRANPPKELGGSKVILSKDYKTQNRRSNSIWKYKEKWVVATVSLLLMLLQWKRLKQ